MSEDSNLDLDIAVQNALAEENDLGFDPDMSPEVILAAKMRLESIDFSDWGDEVSADRWAKLAIVAVLHSTMQYTWDQIASIVGVTRMTVHRWRMEDGGAPYAKARRLVKESRVGHIEGLAMVALEDTLVNGDRKDKLKAAIFTLERREGDFLDPKFKPKALGGDLEDEEDPFAGMTIDQLKALADLVSDKSVDLKALVSEVKKKGKVIDK